MKFESKEEFAKAIIDAGEDGLVSKEERVFFSSDDAYMNPFRYHLGKHKSQKMASTWKMYNEDWQPYVKPIPDKALVWCWDNDWNTMRALRVYDANNKSVFHSDGGRSEFVVRHANHQQLTDEEIQPWMQELIDNCEE